MDYVWAIGVLTLQYHKDLNPTMEEGPNPDDDDPLDSEETDRRSVFRPAARDQKKVSA